MAIELHDAYERLAEQGFNYGPTFQGLRAAWQRGDQLFAEVRLPQGQNEQAGLFNLHPALLDTAFHPAMVPLDGATIDASPPRIPFSWAEVGLYASGVSSVRIAIDRPGDGDAVSAALSDEQGMPVAFVGSLLAREVSGELLSNRRDAHPDALLRLTWPALPAASPAEISTGAAALLGEDGCALGGSLGQAGFSHELHPDLASLSEAIAGGAPAPETVLVDCRGGVLKESAGVPGAARELLDRALSLMRAWLADERFVGCRMVFITEGAVAARPGDEVPDLVAAPLWGLLRSGQSEHRERFVLVDVDGPEAFGLLGTALDTGESQLALRSGDVLVPRVARVGSHTNDESPVLSGRGTVLITGGLGGLGGLMARHLVLAHGVRHLLLTSRTGPEAEGAPELITELEELGAQVTAAACDVADRAQLGLLLDSIPDERPLSAVLHAAATFDNSMIDSLTAEQVDRVLRPKLDAALHLHELTQDMELEAFVLFSSMAGIAGGPGQGNYAAGNTFLDALASHRRSRGLVATAIAWSMWNDIGAGRLLDEADRQRSVMLMAGSAGFGTLSAERGLKLFDLALGGDAAVVLAAPLDGRVLKAEARAGVLPPLLSDLAPISRRRTREASGSLARRLADTPEAEREGVVLELVRSHVTAVLGHASSEAIDTKRAFKELGLDSLTAVELRNRLTAATGLRLPATLVFDYPTSLALTGYLLNEVAGIQVKAPVAVSVAHLDEPLAIVGMSCRYPGGVSSPEELWKLIEQGVDAVSWFPSDRGWDLEGLYDPDPEHVGTSYTREGGFLYDAGEFDAAFFGISPKEALTMDAQQRLLLEASWEAFEYAGIDPLSLKGSQTGVFAGLMHHDYGDGPSGSGFKGLEGYGLTGRAGSVVAGRVSYTFGFEGPAVTVDTACSSSLVALHLAGQALRGGECSLAVAGGVAVMASPSMIVGFSAQRGLARDGRCKSYADAADGVGWSEGVGVVLLERLSDARRNGHQVLGLVRGSAVNQDGASNGLSAPNGPSQQRLIAQALANSRLSARQVDAVEGHGTGTTLGDPIEAQALLATYGQERPEGRPLWLGSVKSNIGHTQAAAGVAGVIKMVMAMRRGVLPRTLHVDEPSTHVDWSAGEVSLLTEPLPWERGGEPRRAGVSSFGVSGTNAHVILEEAPTGVNGAGASASKGVDGVGDGAVAGVGAVFSGGVVPWVVSGKSVPALRGQAGRLLVHVAGASELDVADVGVSLAARSVFERRAVVVGGGREGLLEGLAALAEGEPGPGVVEGVGPLVGGGPVFVFSGQGGQWLGMGVELLDSSAVFAGLVRECGEVLEPLAGWVLEDVLRGVGGAPGLDRVDVVQPVLWAVMVSLAGLWRACGVVPVGVVGHSQGEIAAACVAGGLSLEDGARLVVGRSRALVGLMGRGGMVSVALGAEEVGGRLGGWGGRLGLAAVNGPGSVVVSGEREALDGFLAELVEGGVRAREIPVGYASHSSQIEEIREELLDACVGIVPRAGGVPFYSTVTGGLLDTGELDADYWYRNLRETVRFDAVTRVLLGEGRRVFVEVGPHPVLSVAVQETVDEVLGEAVVVGSLRRGEGGAERFLTSLAEVWVRGVEVDWAKLFPDSARRVGLPTYAFQRERYWLMGSPGAGDVSSAGLVSAGHPLLAAAVGLAGGEEWLFTGRISLESHVWLADHMVMGVVLLPGSAFLELALHVGSEVGCGVVQELTLEAPLVLGEEGAVQLQVSVGEPDESGQRPVGIYSRAQDATGGERVFSEQEWMRHASGTLAAEVHAAVEDRDAGIEARAGVLVGGSWPPADAEPMDVDGLYDRLAKRGLEYGPAFQGLRAAWRRGNEVFAEVLLSEGEQREAEAFGVHPALLDAALHVGSVVAADSDEDGDGTAVRLPFSFGGVSLYARGASTLRVCLSLAGDGAPSLTVANEAGELVASADSLVAREVSATLLSAASSAGSQSSLYRLSWRQVSPAKGPVMEDWVLLGDEQSAIAAALKTANPGLRVHRDLQAIGEAAGDGVGDDVPSVVFVDLRHDSSSEIDGVSVPELVRRIASGALELMQQWISDERFASSRMVLLTQDAAAVQVTEAPDADAMPSKEDVMGLAQSSVWGLVRSAQLESPGRFVLIDVYDDEACWGGLGGALALGEPQLAVREGELFIPRLARAGALPDEGVTGIDPDGTVLITGGTGVLGGLLARRLVSHHGVGHLLLTSRRGEEAQGAAELRAELESLGAKVRIAACDVADSGQLAGLLDSIAEEHPLHGVVHAAGAIDDGVIGSLTAERLDGVLAPKADAAWHLHRLTEHLDLPLFVLLSSVAGTLGSPGQGNYAAANAFLDALVAHRRARGLSGMSMAWGLWAQDSGLTGALSETDRARMKHSGMSALSSEEGLELFDAVLGGGEALMLPVSLDLAVLRAQARTGTLPAIFAGLVRVPTRRPSDQDASFTRRLAAVPEAEREGFTLEMVRGEVAAVLGHASADAIDVQRAFKDLGFDSLAAVELRNRLNATTGLRLPATLVFDYPTTTALASHLLLGIAQPPTITADSLNADLDRLERILSSIAIDDTERARITARLQALSGLSEGQAADSKVMVAQRLQSASADEVFDFIDNGLSRSAAEDSPVGETGENGNAAERSPISETSGNGNG